MILDTIGHAAVYAPLGESLAKGLELLSDGELLAREDGKYEFPGGLLCILQSYETKPLDTIVAETHKKYIDIQCLLSGEESVGWLPAEELGEPNSQPGPDCWKFRCEPRLIAMRTGEFTVFFPGDAHAPCLRAGEPCHVRKLVVKVPVE